MKTLEIERLNPTIGAIVRGVDVAKPQTGETIVRQRRQATRELLRNLFALETIQRGQVAKRGNVES